MIISEVEAGTEQLGPVIKQYMGPMISAIAGSFEGMSEEECQAAIAEIFENVTLEISQTSGEQIHLGTGWPIILSSDSYVLCKIMDQEANRHVERIIRYVNPNE